MKCTTRQTHTGALEGTPFPPVWLKRFSELVSLDIFNVLSLTCKRIHQHLRLNIVWKERCKELPEYQELSDYEKSTWVGPEGFWYEWWCDRVVRKIPRLKIASQPRNDMSFVVPGIMCVKILSNQDTKKPVLVIVSKIVLPNNKTPGHFYVANTINSLDDIETSDIIKFKTVSKYKVAVRPNGNLSINIELIL